MKDTFGRKISYLRLSVTERCNLRCKYCMPAEGIEKKPQSEMLTEEEMVMAVEAAASLGIRKLRITGGEPLIKKNILSICKKMAHIPGIEEVCMTTNGLLLPDMAVLLRQAGVDRLNISLDTLQAEKYASITRGGTLEAALAGLEAALQAGFQKIKLNAVLIGGFNDDEIRDLAELTRKLPVDMRFIELMPMLEDDLLGPQSYIPSGVVLEKLPELRRVPGDGGVAKLYRLPGAKGDIGLISPVYAHFCGSCNRLRITADGRIKPCLHSEAEYTLKGLTMEQMAGQLEAAILAKPAQHEDLSWTSHSHANRTMNRIGG